MAAAPSAQKTKKAATTKKTSSRKAGKKNNVAYSSKYADMLIKKADTDETFFGTRTEIMKVIGCGRQTYYNWKKLHKEFDDAVKYATEVGLDKMEHAALERASGLSKTVVRKVSTRSDGLQVTEVTETTHPPDTRALMFYLTNKRPDEWKEKVDVKHNGNITIVFESQDEGLI